MSEKTYLEAIESVLDSEMQARCELIVFRPGARRALEESEQDVPLPRLGAGSFSVALGAALAGMYPILDLRQENDPASLLLDALSDLPAGFSPAMTVIVHAEETELLAELPGVQLLFPKTPRQAAGFTRSALRSGRLTLLIADQTLYGMEDDVPEEDDFMLLPLDGTEELEGSEAEEAVEEICPRPEENGCAAEEECEAEEPDDAFAAMTDAEEADAMASDETEENGAEDEAVQEESEEENKAQADEEAEENPEESEEAAVESEEKSAAADETPDEAKEPDEREPENEPPAEPVPEAIPAAEKKVLCAARAILVDMSRLHALADELDAPAEWLVARCMERAAERSAGFAWRYEADAQPGEQLFLPPEGEEMSLWLGGNMLTVSYDAAHTAHAEAAALIRAAKRLLEKPTLLIYDRERDAK